MRLRTSSVPEYKELNMAVEMEWEPEAEKQLEKVPVFLRSQARELLIQYARDKGVSRITMVEVEEAKKKYLGA
jgi:hypothetical protein